jgi:hypothetical protein
MRCLASRLVPILKNLSPFLDMVPSPVVVIGCVLILVGFLFIAFGIL